MPRAATAAEEACPGDGVVGRVSALTEELRCSEAMTIQRIIKHTRKKTYLS